MPVLFLFRPAPASKTFKRLHPHPACLRPGRTSALPLPARSRVRALLAAMAAVSSSSSPPQPCFRHSSILSLFKFLPAIHFCSAGSFGLGYLLPPWRPIPAPAAHSRPCRPLPALPPTPAPAAHSRTDGPLPALPPTPAPAAHSRPCRPLSPLPHPPDSAAHSRPCRPLLPLPPAPAPAARSCPCHALPAWRPSSGPAAPSSLAAPFRSNHLLPS